MLGADKVIGYVMIVGHYRYMSLLKGSEHVCGYHCFLNHSATVFFWVGFSLHPASWFVIKSENLCLLIIGLSFNSIQVDILSKYGEVFGIIVPSPLNSRFNLEISDFSLWYISHLFGTSLVSCSGVFLSSLNGFGLLHLYSGIIWNL